MDISVDIETFANNLSELVSILAMAKGIQVQQWTAQTYFNSVGWCAYFHEVRQSRSICNVHKGRVQKKLFCYPLLGCNSFCKTWKI